MQRTSGLPTSGSSRRRNSTRRAKRCWCRCYLNSNAAKARRSTERSKYLREGGLDIEHFGERTYRIVATPAGYGARAFDIAGVSRRSDRRAKATRRARTHLGIACMPFRDARRRTAGFLRDALGWWNAWQQCENPMHCPHGRPTIVRLDSQAIHTPFQTDLNMLPIQSITIR